MPRLHELEAGAEADMPASASWQVRDGRNLVHIAGPGGASQCAAMRTPPETPARRNVLGLRRGARGRWGGRAGRPTGGRRNRPTARGTLETVRTTSLGSLPRPCVSHSGSNESCLGHAVCSQSGNTCAHQVAAGPRGNRRQPFPRLLQTIDNHTASMSGLDSDLASLKRQSCCVS